MDKENNQTEPDLLSGLKSKDKDIRLTSAIALCATGKMEFIAPVVGIMNKITWDEAEELSLSMCIFGEPAIPFMLPLLQNGKKSTVACVIRTLGHIKGKKAAELLVQELISLPTKSEPTEALVMMGTEGIPYLLPLIGHNKADVRAMAAFALGKIGDKNSLTALERLAQTDKSEKVQEIASRAITWLLGQEECNTDLRNTFGEVVLGPH